MLLKIALYFACFIIPLFVGALALAPFRYHFCLSVFIHWLIFTIIIICIVVNYGVFEVTAGITGVLVGMIMIIPALFINFWATVCLLVSFNIKDKLGYLIVYPTFFVMGYSAFILGMYGAAHFGLFPDESGTNNWASLIYACFLTVSPALVAILKRLFNPKLAYHFDKPK